MPTRSDTRDQTDPFDLQRFVRAQEPVYPTALEEIRQGQKRTHWMWFIFPQIDGLGHSSTSKHYAIKSAEEARAYLSHPVLGARLKACVQALLEVRDRSALHIFGSPDDLKLRSCMTLFAAVACDEPVFARALAIYFESTRDTRTLQLLDMQHP